jgi:hypothetical protein
MPGMKQALLIALLSDNMILVVISMQSSLATNPPKASR